MFTQTAERCVTILKMTAREISFFQAWPKLNTDSIKEASKVSKTLILFQMEEDMSPASLNVTGESSWKYYLNW